MKLFSVQDVKAAAFTAPTMFRTPGVAIRWFEEMAKNPDCAISKSPKDYALHELGDYDELTGVITPHDKTTVLALATEFVQ